MESDQARGESGEDVILVLDLSGRLDPELEAGRVIGTNRHMPFPGPLQRRKFRQPSRTAQRWIRGEFLFEKVDVPVERHEDMIA